MPTTLGTPTPGGRVVVGGAVVVVVLLVVVVFGAARGVGEPLHEARTQAAARRAQPMSTGR
jgi:hypothetical protein